MQSRYYNPEWGRFINADGITGQTGKLLAHNMFAYCQNDPVNAFDPTGFVMVEDMEGGIVSINNKSTYIGEKGQQMKKEASESLANSYETTKNLLISTTNYIIVSAATAFMINYSAYKLSKTNINGYKFTPIGSLVIANSMSGAEILIDAGVANRSINTTITDVGYVIPKNALKYIIGDVLYRFDK